MIKKDTCSPKLNYHPNKTSSPESDLIPYLSTFIQSKLCLMTTGGASGLAFDGCMVPDRQGEVSTQHNPSAASGGDKDRGSKIKYSSHTYKPTNTERT